MTAPDDLARLAAEIPKHSAGMGSEPGTLGTDRDDGGLRCSCKGWKHGPDEKGLRPWPEFWLHQAEHLASVVSRRDADLQAKAWDEGYGTAQDDNYRIQRGGGGTGRWTDNPYRSRRPADTDTGRGQ